MKEFNKKYKQLGGIHSILESPLTDIQNCADGMGRYRRYQNGIIYSHPEAGIHEIHGDIMVEWQRLGAEKSFLGYPTSDVLKSAENQAYCSCFQHGRIYLGLRGIMHITDLFSDQAQLDWIAFNAKYLPKDWIKQYHHIQLPEVLDYSNDVNFTRTQGNLDGGGWGGYGCITYALLHCVDIIKGWEHPYCPAVSWRYAEWYCMENPQTADELTANGFASEGQCHTNWDNEFRFITDPRMIAEKKKYYPIPTWDEPNVESKEETSHCRVKFHPEKDYAKAKPKDTAQGLLSPSVDEIKMLLKLYGPVQAKGSGHSMAIIGFNDLKREFTILDSYIHSNNNFTTIAYEKIGPGELFTTKDEGFIYYLSKSQISDALRATFANNGWTIPDNVVISSHYDSDNKQWHYFINANPNPVNEINIVFRVIKVEVEGKDFIKVYDNEILIEEFRAVINIIDETKVDTPLAYSARIKIDNNWRGTYTVSIGVEGLESLVVWTTRGRNLQNVYKSNGIDVIWETPVEDTHFLAIDVPLPFYAKEYWPPNSNHRWVLTVEDHDRDGVTGQITEFTLARRYRNPDCLSVGKFATETFSSKGVHTIPDPASGQPIVSLDVLSPPKEANPNPGIKKVYVPDSKKPPGPSVHLPKIRYSFSIKKEDISAVFVKKNKQEVTSKVIGSLQSFFDISPNDLQVVPNKEVKLMQLDRHTCKPWQWLEIAKTTTDDGGNFHFDLKFIYEDGITFGVAFYNEKGNQVLASSEFIQYKLKFVKPNLPKLYVHFPDFIDHLSFTNTPDISSNKI